MLLSPEASALFASRRGGLFRRFSAVKTTADRARGLARLRLTVKGLATLIADVFLFCHSAFTPSSSTKLFLVNISWPTKHCNCRQKSQGSFLPGERHVRIPRRGNTYLFKINQTITMSATIATPSVIPVATRLHHFFACYEPCRRKHLHRTVRYNPFLS